MGIEETLREFVTEELAGMYTISMVVVESVDESTRRAEVSLKYNRDVILDNVPIAAPFTGDGVGVVWPVTQDDEGFVLHNRQPIQDALGQLGHLESSSDRRFQVEDAVLFPLIWNDEQTVPDHEQGEFIVAHDSGTIIRVKPDGMAELIHEDGNTIRMNADGSVTLGDPNSAAALLNENASITDSSGGSCSIDDPGTTDVEGS